MSRRSNHPDQDLCCYARCPHNGRVIADRRLSVRISNGLMHRDCHAEQTRRVAEILAPREGAVPWTTVCEGCRQWVDGIFAVTFTGSRICITCAARNGDEIAVVTLTRQGRWDPATRQPIEAPPPPPLPSPLPPSPPAEHPRPATRNFSNLMSLLDDL